MGIAVQTIEEVVMHVEIGPRDKPAGDSTTVYVDCVAREGVAHKAAWGVDKLPFEDSSVDAIYASHVIEHVLWYDVDYALSEAFRVLSAGGSIELWTPDFAAIVAAYLDNGIPEQDTWRRSNPEGDLMRWVNGRLFAYCDDTEGVENLHKSVHDFRSLSRQLTAAGFVDLKRAVRAEGHNPHGPCEFGIVAVKPSN